MPGNPQFCHQQILTYRADIDGLRAIAVLVVLFFHADIGFPGGFVGVDVFFVISGYLITGLILKDLNVGEFCFFEFWERRIRRIMPALSVVVFSCLIAGWLFFLPRDFKGLGRSAVAQAILASNVNFWLESDYFGQAAELKPLLHTWSLAVEEQFYLLFPFLLVAVHRVSRSSIVPVILVFCCVSFALSVYCSYRYPGASFYLLPMRAWELLIGAFLSAIPRPRRTIRWLNEAVGWGGLLAILYAVFFYDRDTRFPGIAAVLPCAGAAMVIWANCCTLTSVGTLLAAPPVVFIGLISYSLYLWHWPILVLPRYLVLDPLPMSQRVVLLIASLILAVLTWRFVETPFRRRLILDKRVHMFSFAGIATAITFFVGLFIYELQGVPSRIPDAARRYSDGSINDYVFVQKMSYRVGLTEALAGDFVELGAGDKRLPISLLLWGDSHAASVLPIIDILCKEHSIRGVAAMYAGTVPLVGYESQGSISLKEKSIAYNNAVAEFIRRNHVSNVMLVAKWGGYVTAGGSDRIRLGIQETIIAMGKPTPKIYIMRQVPKPRWEVPRALAITVLKGQDADRVGISLEEYRKEFERQNPAFQGISKEFPSVAILDPTECFVNQRQLCRLEENGAALYCDDSHLSSAGAAVLRPLFDSIFLGIAKETKLPGS